MMKPPKGTLSNSSFIVIFAILPIIFIGYTLQVGYIQPLSITIAIAVHWELPALNPALYIRFPKEPICLGLRYPFALLVEAKFLECLAHLRDVLLHLLVEQILEFGVRNLHN